MTSTPSRARRALILVHDRGRLYLHWILLVQGNLRNAGHPGDDGKREIDDARHGVVPVHTLRVRRPLSTQSGHAGLRSLVAQVANDPQQTSRVAS